MIYYILFDDHKGNLRTAEVQSTLRTVDAVALAYEAAHKVRVLEVRLIPSGKD